MLMLFDHVASRIVNADHGILWMAENLVKPY
jgi:hypothetical protein